MSAGQVGRIRRLPSALVDQIAAGEVVERPASVVKELVENALDASASRVRVELRDGGLSFVAVTDDGFGMSAAEARLALERHATSKLAVLDDLRRIASFGFRGEALPAVASVSRLRLLTRARGSDSGHEIRVEAGVVRMERASGCPVGTRIEVAELFAAIPARRKFLKKPATEWGHAIDWLGRLALALPGVHFDVVRDDREAIVWPATDDPLARIEAVLGREASEGMRAATHEEPGGHAEVFVSPVERTRANANGLYLHVNGRPVRDRLLRHAVLDAYREWLPRGRFPTAVVAVTVDPGAVDVNVHPAKWEVRFVDPQAVHGLVVRAIRAALRGREPLITQGRSDAGSSNPARARTVAGRELGGNDWLFATPSPRSDRVGEPRPHEPSAEAAYGGASDAANARPAPALAKLRLLGQLLASYLVLEADDGLLLIDQHAAHERVLYERLRAGWLAAGVARQGLLLPVDVELAPLTADALDGAGDTVRRLGFEIERFGERAVVVRAIPALLAGRDPAALVRDVAEEIEQSGGAPDNGPAAARLVASADRLFATLACHGARRFGDALPIEEQRAILAGLDALPWAHSCPHGRPVATRIARSEIERRFGRH